MFAVTVLILHLTMYLHMGSICISEVDALPLLDKPQHCKCTLTFQEKLVQLFFVEQHSRFWMKRRDPCMMPSVYCPRLLRIQEQFMEEVFHLSYSFPNCLYSPAILYVNFLFVIFLGCSEMLMAHAVTELAKRTPGKESVAMESFAIALRTVSSRI